MTPKTYRKRPTIIEAVQWTGDNEEEIRIFVGLAPYANRDYGFEGTPDCSGFFVIPEGDPMAGGRLWVAANDTWLPIAVGEWVAKDSAGFYPIKDEIFTKTYDEVVGSQEDLKNQIDGVTE